MQIRYQNVQKNITYMSVSFAFMKKVLESAHPSFSSFDTTMNSELEKNSKKYKKIWWRRTTNVLSACQVSLGNDIRGSRGKKIIYFGVLIVFFCRGSHECYSLMKLGRHLKHLSFFATKFFYFFILLFMMIS